MAGFEGLDQFINEVRAIPKRLEQKGKELIADTANSIVADAVINLRANGTGDLGGLMQSITALPKDNGLKSEVFVAKDYAPSVEFGTKGRVDFKDQPPEKQALLRSYAQQFKGTPTGTWDEFLREMTAWVKRKGLTGVYSVKTRKRLTGAKYDNDAEDEGLAYLIARSIYLHGITPKPFFFPAWFKNEKEFELALEKMMKETIWQRLVRIFKGR